MTINQKIRTKRNKKLNIKFLSNKPQLKGTVIKVLTMKPKKPNSANRKVCRVKLFNGSVVTAYISGIGHNLNQHSIVLLKHGITKDLPGLRFKVVRGVFDCAPVANRKTSRSKYGVKK